MPKYTYPVIITKEVDENYAVIFPDFENCFTSGSTLKEAKKAAKDVLTFIFYRSEINKTRINIPSTYEKCEQCKCTNPTSCNEERGVYFIEIDTDEYRYSLIHQDEKTKKVLKQFLI